MNEPIAVDEARTRVARGAALLDHERPGWASRIDLGMLAIEQCYRCVLAQVWESGGYFAGRAALFGAFGTSDQAHVEAVACGFVANICETQELMDLSYQRLQDAWIEAIADRLVVPAVQPAKVLTEQPA